MVWLRYLFRKPISIITSNADGGLLFIYTVSLTNKSEKSAAAATQLNSSLEALGAKLQPVPLRVNQRAVRFLA